MHIRFSLLSGLFLLIALPTGVVWAQDVVAGPVVTVPVEEAPLVVETAAPDALVFLELFTAEHCAFCPAAERNFNDILTGDNVIGISCMVNYFDSGTPSMLAQPFCKDQQQVYTRMMRTGSLYTPQLVINGSAQVPGHNLQKVTEAIRTARMDAGQPRALMIKSGADAGDYDVILPGFEAAQTEPDEKFILRMIMIKRDPDLSMVNSQQQRRELTPRNTALTLIEGGLWDGRRTVWNITPPKDDLSDAFVVLVQNRKDGHILAAGQHSLTPDSPTTALPQE